MRRIVTVSLTTLLLCARPALSFADRAFHTWTSWSSPGSPQSVAVGDLTGDGRPDVVVANAFSGSVRVYRGATDATLGTFADVALPGPAEPRDVALARVDADADADVLVTDRFGSIVTMLNAGGSFAVSASSPTSIAPARMAVGDLDGDGEVDVVTCGATTAAFEVLLGDGSGAFTSHQVTSTGSPPRDVVLADLDGDLDRDLIVSDPGAGGASWYANDGSGGFGAAQVVSTGEEPRALAVLDVDSDGDADVVVGDALQPAVDVWRNDGTGAFIGPEGTFTTDVPVSLTPAQLTGDAREELLVSNDVVVLNGALTVLALDDDGFLNEVGTFACPNGPLRAAAADADADGDADVYVAGSIADAVGVLLNDGAGALPGGLQIGVGSQPSDALLAPLDADVLPDLIVPNQGANSVTIALNTGGAFGSAVELPVGSLPSAAAVLDVNGDGDLDVIVANFGSDNISIMHNNGLGAFPTVTTMAAGDGPSAIAVGNLNGDALPDLAIADVNSHRITILLGNGTGGFIAAPAPILVGANPTSVALLDLDGDGLTDVVSADDGASRISYALGVGGGAFDAPASLFIPGGAIAVASGDFTGDAIRDVIVVNDQSSTLTIAKNTAGTLSIHATVATGRNPIDVALGDVDHDSIDDAVVTNVLGNTISLLPGLAAGGFGSRTDYGTGGGSGYVVLGDVDADFDVDALATGDPAAGADAWLLGNRLGGVTSSRTIVPVASASRGGAITMAWTCTGASDLSVVRREGTRVPVPLGAPWALADGRCGIVDAAVIAGASYRYEVWSHFGSPGATLLAFANAVAPRLAAPRVAPQPVHGAQFSVSLAGLDTSRGAKVRVYAPSGRVVARASAAAHATSAMLTHALPGGTYVVEVRAGARAERERIVIAR